MFQPNRGPYRHTDLLVFGDSCFFAPRPPPNQSLRRTHCALSQRQKGGPAQSLPPSQVDIEALGQALQVVEQKNLEYMNRVHKQDEKCAATFACRQHFVVEEKTSRSKWCKMVPEMVLTFLGGGWLYYLIEQGL